MNRGIFNIQTGIVYFTIWSLEPNYAREQVEAKRNERYTFLHASRVMGIYPV
jgi:hypothetical protein